MLAHRKADGAGDAVIFVFVEQQLDDEDALVDVFDADGLLGRLGDDGFVTLAVDHDLPAPRAYRFAAIAERHALGLLVLPDGQAPFLEEMNRVVDVAANIVNQVVARQPHEIGRDHAAIIVWRVLAEIGVDGGKALGHGARAVHGGLVDQRDADVVTSPALGLVGRAAGRHAAADDEDIGLDLDDFRVTEGALDHGVSSNCVTVWAPGAAVGCLDDLSAGRRSGDRG